MFPYLLVYSVHHDPCLSRCFNQSDLDLVKLYLSTVHHRIHVNSLKFVSLVIFMDQIEVDLRIGESKLVSSRLHLNFLQMMYLTQLLQAVAPTCTR